jgi:TIR domain
MKVFVSHSSADKWIARQIATELERRDIEAFLDEKDIKTGDSIDDAVHANLAECDELLMLLSPASLESPWVLIEIGGAKALGKRLVPILHHVGANELPAPLALGLARDLNDIERYYAEVVVRSRLPEAERQTSAVIDQGDEPAVSSRLPRKFAEGARVRLPQRVPSKTTARDGRDIGWSPHMEDLLGVETEVTEALEPAGIVRVDADNGHWLWLADWLTPIPAEG